LEKEYSTRGTEILVDFWDMDNVHYFDDPEVMEKTMRDALLVEDIVPVMVTHKKFEPFGLTMMMLLEESHFNIHLYPESSFMAVSLYTCGSAETDNIIDTFERAFNPKEVKWKKVARGIR
jgi:S-adenosylmethionine decarboxylase